MTLSGKCGGAGRGNPIIAEIGTHTQFRRAGNGVRPLFFHKLKAAIAQQENNQTPINNKGVPISC